MTDQNPAPRGRPQFGEFATPEEQRAAIAVPVDLAASEPVPVADEGRPVTAAAPPPAPTEAPATAGTVRAPLDRFASWALLGLGLFNILSTSPALIDLPGAITQFFAGEDLDPYGPVGLARALGIGALVINAALWVLTLAIVQRRVNAGRHSWWIPLVAGVVGNVVVLACVGGAMMIDPAVFAHIQQLSGVSP